MRWLFLFFIFVVGVGLSIFAFGIIMKPQSKSNTTSIIPTSPPVSGDSQKRVSLTRQTIFVPYWELAGNDISFPEYDFLNSAEKRVIYFGVAVDKDGVQKGEAGYTNISLFLDRSPKDVKKYLGVRMTDDTVNSAILADSAAQKAIIDDVLEIAGKNSFDGIAVDLEMKPTLNGNAPAQINSFISSFVKQSHEKNMKLAMTLYGDNFYRARPYDVPYLMKQVDELMIMAYDLHKATGEPGPNFPLEGKETYGYDMNTLVADFAGVPADKLTIVYGMYGYDWVVDENKRPIRPAKSVTLNDVKANYLDRCAVLNCVTQRDKKATENEIDFIDKQLLYHVIWYEDQDSVKNKTEFLNTKGIGSVAFWAAGYY